MAPSTPVAGPSPATIDGMVSGLAAQPPVSLTYQEVVAAALHAGFSDSDAVTMAAISTMETSRNCIAVSGKNLTGGRAWGAFAVNLGDNQVNDAGWMVPVTNAAQARTQAGTYGMRSWPSYASGLYVAAVPGAQFALAGINAHLASQPAGSRDATLQQLAQPNDVAGQIAGIAIQWQAASVIAPTVATGVDATGQLGAAAADATNQAVFKPFGSVLDFLNALGSAQTWIRVAYAVIGGALIIVAMREIAK